MKRLLLILLVPIVAVQVQGGQLVISSLPYTLNQSSHSGTTWDTVKLSGNLTSTHEGIRLGTGTHHWLLDFSGTDGVPLTADDQQITYSTDSTYKGDSVLSGGIYYFYGSRGIYIPGSSYSIRIRGGKLHYHPDNIEDSVTAWVAGTFDTVNNAAAGIWMGGESIIVDSVAIDVRGYAGDFRGVHCIYTGGRNHIIRGCDLDNDVYAYNTRGRFPACCVKIDGASTLLATDSFHVRIIGGSFRDRAHCPIYDGRSNTSATGGGIVQIDGVTIIIDIRNYKYSSIEGGTLESGAERGYANGYGIQLSYAAGGSYIKNCTITAGTTYHGGRGIQMENVVGTAANPIVICSNYVSTHEACDVQFSGAYGYFPCAMKARSSEGLHVYDNDFIYTADGSVAIATSAGQAGSYYRYGHAFVYEQEAFAPTAATPYNITIERNLMRTILLHGNTGGFVEGVCFDRCMVSDPTIIWRNNRVESDYIGYRMGGYDGAARGIVMRGDTVRLTDSSKTSGQIHYMVGYLSNNYTNDSIWAISQIYENSNGTALTGGVVLNFPSTVGTCNIGYSRTINVYALDASGLPIKDVIVTTRNGYGQTVAVDTTNASGLCQPTTTYAWYQRTGGDSLGFNQFTFYGAKGADADTSALNVAWNAYTDTLVLAASTGTPTSVGQGITERGNVRVSGNVVIGKP